MIRQHSPLQTYRRADGGQIKKEATHGWVIRMGEARDIVGYTLSVSGRKGKLGQLINLTYDELRLMVVECERLVDQLRAEHAEGWEAHG